MSITTRPGRYEQGPRLDGKLFVPDADSLASGYIVPDLVLHPDDADHDGTYQLLAERNARERLRYQAVEPGSVMGSLIRVYLLWKAAPPHSTTTPLSLEDARLGHWNRDSGPSHMFVVSRAPKALSEVAMTACVRWPDGRRREVSVPAVAEQVANDRGLWLPEGIVDVAEPDLSELVDRHLDRQQSPRVGDFDPNGFPDAHKLDMAFVRMLEALPEASRV